MTASSLPAALDRALPLLAPEARSAGRLTDGGYLDLLGAAPPESTGWTQDLMVGRMVPTIYERWWRPALGRVAKGVLGPGMAEEHRIARLLLGLSPGDGVLDVACGTGNFTRDFARSVGGEGLRWASTCPRRCSSARCATQRTRACPSARRSCAATPPSCRFATRASTACAASRPCTCSRTRCGRSTA